MQQVIRSIYLVDANETVTVQVRATKVGNFVSFVVDGSPVPALGGSPITFRFQVTVGPGLTHFGMLTCFFPASAPDDAEYQFFLSGSSGGGIFEGSDVVKTDSLLTRSIEFRRP
jgi:hypothetical protein